MYQGLSWSLDLGQKTFSSSTTTKNVSRNGTTYSVLKIENECNIKLMCAWGVAWLAKISIVIWYLVSTVLGPILVEQKNCYCKQTADCLLYSTGPFGGTPFDRIKMLIQCNHLEWHFLKDFWAPWKQQQCRLMKIDESRDDLDDQSAHHCVYGTQTPGLLSHSVRN